MMLYFSSKFSFGDLFYIQSWAIPLKNPDVMMVFPDLVSVEELPGSPVIRTHGFDPRQRTKIRTAMWHSQKKKVRILICKIKPLANIESWESHITCKICWIFTIYMLNFVDFLNDIKFSLKSGFLSYFIKISNEYLMIAYWVLFQDNIKKEKAK